MSVGVQQQQRRATETAWVTSGYILAAGEVGYATDSHIIKMGDGVNTWDNLTIPYDGRYLPINGKAADSEMLDGISSAGFLLVGDATTAATADKVARRDSNGRLKSATGIATDDVVNYDQMIANARMLISRTVTANFTLALADINSIVRVNNSAYTPTVNCTIPANETVAFPVGSCIDLVSNDKGSVTLVPAGGVTLLGASLLYGGGSSLRLVKTGTDEWQTVRVSQSPGPLVRRRVRGGSDNTIPATTFMRLRLDGGDSGTALFTNNADSLGTNQQWSTADLYRVFCRRSGWYDVAAQVGFNNSGSGRCIVQIRVNNIEQNLGNTVSRASNTEITALTHGVLPLSVGDYAEVWVYQESGSSSPADTGYSASYMQWMWQRPL